MVGLIREQNHCWKRLIFPPAFSNKKPGCFLFPRHLASKKIVIHSARLSHHFVFPPEEWMLLKEIHIMSNKEPTILKPIILIGPQK